MPTLAALAGTPEPEQYGFKGQDLTPILADPTASVQDVLHFTYEDDVFPVKGADCIRAITERDWKYAVYYDPFTRRAGRVRDVRPRARPARDDQPRARRAQHAGDRKPSARGSTSG